MSRAALIAAVLALAPSVHAECPEAKALPGNLLEAAACAKSDLGPLILCLDAVAKAAPDSPAEALLREIAAVPDEQGAGRKYCEMLGDFAKRGLAIVESDAGVPAAPAAGEQGLSALALERQEAGRMRAAALLSDPFEEKAAPAAVSAFSAPLPYAKPGTKSVKVHDLQVKLNVSRVARGLPRIAEDSDYGGETRRAVAEWKRAGEKSELEAAPVTTLDPAPGPKTFKGPGAPVVYRAPMKIDSDGAGGAWKKDVWQKGEKGRAGSQRGKPTTSLSGRDANGNVAYLNASKIPFIVLPRNRKFEKEHGIKLGDYVAIVRDDGRIAFAVFGDRGPSKSEASIRAARNLGFDANVNSGGSAGEKVTYIVFPGSSKGFPKSEADIYAEAQRLYLAASGR